MSGNTKFESNEYESDRVWKRTDHYIAVIENVGRLTGEGERVGRVSLRSVHLGPCDVSVLCQYFFLAMRILLH